MDKMEATGLTLVVEDGTLWTKDKPRVESLKGLEPVAPQHTLEQVRVRVQGDVAVLTGVQVNKIRRLGATRAERASRLSGSEKVPTGKYGLPSGRRKRHQRRSRPGARLIPARCCGNCL